MYQSGVSDPDAYCRLPSTCPYASADPNELLPASKIGARACSGAVSGRTSAEEEEARAKSATLVKPMIRTMVMSVVVD